MRLPRIRCLGVALPFVGLLFLPGCGVVSSYVNSEDKLAGNLKVGMTEGQVMKLLGKPDMVRNDAGGQLVFEYLLYPSGHWIKELAGCPFTFIAGGCIFYPYVNRFDKEGHPTSYLVVLLNDRVCRWGKKDEVSAEGQCQDGFQAGLNLNALPEPEDVRQLVDVSVSPLLMPPRIQAVIRNVAVVPLSDTAEYSGLKPLLDLALNFLRSRHPQMILAEREELSAIDKELLLQYSGRVDDNSIAGVGKMNGADTLLIYRIDPHQRDPANAISRLGGVIEVTFEIRLVRVEEGSTLFRQAVTATTTLRPPSAGRTWTESRIQYAQRQMAGYAASFGVASLTSAFGDNPMGIVPDLTRQEAGMGVLGILHGSPSHVAGIKKGDRIVAVNGRPITVWTQPVALPAVLTVQRDGESLEITVRSPLD